ncbi:PAS fold [Nocardioides scoriae]|uniref:histidine kinase n=1 Tax=Nocardioides scoriae TaxID=642780 RepID=A0A1H1LAM3_9ACTN|nr:histidine kinase dimerization/phospho-acceptor domain-containing protein [Nocardioides scoriae]SDR71634.1 PAS fold [Nocardioides scoriae]
MLTTQDPVPGPATPVTTVDQATVQALMCRAGLAVAVLDGSGRLSMLSPALERLLHRRFEVVPSESLAEVFHLYGDGGARLLETHEIPIVRASRGEVVDGATVTVKTPGQPVRHLRVNATPMVGGHGERQGAWALMTDVTGLVAAARGELNRSLAETVNHHLRTPLTTMLGHAELLMDQQDDFAEEARHSLEALWGAGQRLNEVVAAISEWIDLAYTPTGRKRGNGRGRGTDLADHLDSRQRLP